MEPKLSYHELRTDIVRFASFVVLVAAGCDFFAQSTPPSPENDPPELQVMQREQIKAAEAAEAEREERQKVEEQNAAPGSSAAEAQAQADAERSAILWHLCDKLTRLADPALSMEECVEVHADDANRNLDALKAYYGCVEAATTWKAIGPCIDKNRNGKSSTFALRVDALDQTAIASTKLVEHLRFDGVWAYAVSVSGRVLVVITPTKSKDKADSVAMCLPLEGWEVAALALAEPTKLDWITGVVSGHAERPAGGVAVALAGCLWSQ